VATSPFWITLFSLSLLKYTPCSPYDTPYEDDTTIIPHPFTKNFFVQSTFLHEEIFLKLNGDTILLLSLGYGVALCQTFEK